MSRDLTCIWDWTGEHPVVGSDMTGPARAAIMHCVWEGRAWPFHLQERIDFVFTGPSKADKLSTDLHRIMLTYCVARGGQEVARFATWEDQATYARVVFELDRPPNRR